MEQSILVIEGSQMAGAEGSANIQGQKPCPKCGAPRRTLSEKVMLPVVDGTKGGFPVVSDKAAIPAHVVTCVGCSVAEFYID
jgi:hypothetical protein